MSRAPKRHVYEMRSRPTRSISAWRPSKVIVLAAIVAFGAFAGSVYQESFSFSSHVSTVYEVDHVYDGDTLTILVPNTDGRKTKQRVRLLGIDTAELKTAECPYEHELALEQRDLLRSLVGPRVSIEEHGKDRFGRLLGVVYNEGGTNLNHIMLSEGKARPYDGGYREGWCS